ncbi:MAG: dihydroorotase [Neisseriaceae bacterium]
MTQICNVMTISGIQKDFNLSDGLNEVIDGSELLVVPGLIDPHVHFRVPGMEHKEDWITGSKAAFYGGYTTVFDMPNTKPATNTLERLNNKVELINSQINQSGFPLNYKLFFGADKNNFHHIHQVKDKIAGIKVFMGSSTGDLLVDDESSLHAIYALAAKFNLIVALHAEDELIIRENSNKFLNETDFKYHSVIRSPLAAQTAVKLVIQLSEIYNVTSYVLHVSTIGEIDLIQDAKSRGIKVFAETCPHYLFFDDTMYDKLQGRVKMNPPVRSTKDREYLWQAVNNGLIDTIASDHAPHTLVEKDAVLCKCPSGIPGIETTIPLLITAYKEGKLTLDRIIELAYLNPKKIFSLPENDNLVFLNIKKFKLIEDKNLYTKVKWSPYTGMNLTGFPQYIYANNTLYTL